MKHDPEIPPDWTMAEADKVFTDCQYVRPRGVSYPEAWMELQARAFEWTPFREILERRNSRTGDQKPMNEPDVIEQPATPTPVACSDLFSQSVEYSPLSMVERAVRNARPHRTTEAPRWVAVMDVFGYGSTTSTELCRRFGLDPHEKVPGVKCDCDEIG